MTEYPKPGDTVDLLTLRDLRIREKINVYLYMDEEIAANSTVEEDIKKYRFTDMDFRPVLEIEDWFKNMQKQMKQIVGPAANVEQMLKEQPLAAEIIDTGVLETPVGLRPYLKCLLPFLDEMEEIEVRQATGIKNQ
ncbi:MAG TPA: hypothetical protein O0Y15_01675 [Methanocorpusculum sp.]|jgi:hypothetical protein|nr:hypothetical protein [Methanocorpusculum sp.]MBR5814725.1 hypothetical protein [Methanocorpusculaceae archaeon]MBR5008871.1 hypothetical protein [Methanocorpusculum sp.]MBR5142474.1 hypothetical protein [Methanocorpusculum sp.]MBR5451146.1 hypothetical protein [Methanocorpusculum sp.]